MTNSVRVARTRGKRDPQNSSVPNDLEPPVTASLSEAEQFRFPLSSSIATQIRRVHRRFVQDLERFLEPHDVSVGMWYFFRALWEEDGLSQRVLSDRAGVSTAAAVEQLRNMEKCGYIERRPDVTDKRRVHVFLTKEGRRLKSLLPGAAKMNSIALECLSEGEIGFLGLVLSRVQNSYDQLEPEPKKARREP
jgi:DNA-binding MarR family transcriptional regulator